MIHVLYFSSSIFYVKMRVSRYANKSSAESLTRKCAVYHLFLTATVGVLVWSRVVPALLVPGYLPVLIRAIWGILKQESRLNLKKIGLAEIGFTLIFVVFAALSFRRLPLF
jgi:hypothetical protein